MPRLLATELMDDDAACGDPAEWRGTLDDLARFNAVFGGRRLLRVEIDRLEKLPCRVIDVATGAADLPVFVVEHLRTRGIAATCTAVDRSVKILVAAAERIGHRDDVTLVRADACALPFADQSFDLAMMNLALHHFDEPAAVAALRELARVARDVIVNDLRRSLLASLMARAIFPIFTRNRMTLHDGPVSALRAYVPAEAAALARSAGWSRVAVRAHFGFRMALVGGRS